MGAITLEALKAKVGAEIGVSRWFEITQDMINAFADVTQDWQAIHVDPEAAGKTPFGGTVAHGFLTASMLSAMSYDALPQFEGQSMAVNYGFDRLRFVAPVPAGARIRGRFALTKCDDTRAGEVTTTYDTTVEIEGKDKPALIAQWIGRSYFGGANG